MEFLMKLLSRLLALLLFLGGTTSVMASDFEAALSSKTAQFTFRSDSSVIGWGGADLSLGFFYNEESDVIAQVGLMQMRQASKNNPLTFGVGVKGYLGKLDNINRDILAFGIGGEIRYTIPGTTPMAIYLRGIYAPEITSFSDSEEVVDYLLGFQIEALPQTIAFVGWRHLEFKTDLGDYEADDDKVQIGVRLTF